MTLPASQEPRRVAIIGSRDFPNLDQVRDFVDILRPTDIVVSGGARGVDSVAAQHAQARGLKVFIYPADWETHGKAAGFIRNREIVAHADLVVAFWDGKSKGTRHSIELAEEMKKELEVHYAQR